MPSYVSFETEKKFYELAAQWQNETKFISIVGDKIGHPIYIQIASFTPEIIPLLLRELPRHPSHWLPLLEAYGEPRGIDPIKPEDEGSEEKIINAWLDWGKREGYILE